MNRRLVNLTIGFGLVLLTSVAFYRVLSNGFINYDDDVFVTTNSFVQSGFTPQTIAWAFKSTQWSQWQPLTWLSYMLDYRIWRLDPLGFHLTNLVLHIASVLVLFFVLTRVTGSPRRSGVVAGLFAVHPLHVESVAWVAERKDVLSALFWMLTMATYVYYVQSRGKGLWPAARGYALTFVVFALGLMAKPMVVTLPFVLLLLDYWPLGRFYLKGEHFGKQSSRAKQKLSSLFLEKIPLFALSAVSSVITYLVQRQGGAVSGLWELPLGVRLANSVVAYIAYIVKMVWPTKLTFLYPHPENRLPSWLVVFCAVLLATVTAAVVRQARNRPYLAVGWFWYTGTLVPVIGIVQVGGQAMADRYTYIPLIGLFVAIVWGIGDALEYSKMARPSQGGRFAKYAHQAFHPYVVFSVVILIALGICTWVQTGYWKDNRTVFSRAIECTSRNYMAHNNLGLVYANNNELELAVKHYQRSLQITPRFPLVHNNIGLALARLGRIDEALAHFRQAVQFSPDYADAHNNLANILLALGRSKEAIEHYSEVVRLRPDDYLARYRLANALFKEGRLSEAISEYREVIRSRPDMVPARNNLAVALYLEKRYAEAWDEVHALERYNSRPHEQFIRALRAKMPEPEVSTIR